MQQARELGNRAKSLDVFGVFSDIVLEILQKLENDPLGWGDPVRRTLKQGGVYCHGVLQPLFVNFVVFEAEKVVLIWRILPAPSSVLDRE